MHGCLTARDHVRHGIRNVELRFLLTTASLQKIFEARLQQRKHLWSEAPAVHGNTLRPAESHTLCQIRDALRRALDLRVLAHRLEQSIHIRLADPARHAPMLGESRIKSVAAHAKARSVFLMGFQKSAHSCKRIATVKIIRIDRHKWGINHITGSQNRMPCTPRFRTAFRHAEALRQIIELLKRIAHIQAVLVAKAYAVLELLLKIPANHKHNPVKTRKRRVTHRVVEKRLPARPHAIHLLQSPIPAAHAGSQNKQCCIHKIKSPGRRDSKLRSSPPERGALRS